jgi:uncharacterized protein (UPF0335 family)
MMEQDQEVIAKVLEAQAAVAAAEGSLQQLVGEIQRLPRAEKTTVTEIVRDAFSRLKAARDDLAELEKLLSDAGE